MKRILFLLLCTVLGNSICMGQSFWDLFDTGDLITTREKAVITNSLLLDYLEYQLIPIVEDYSPRKQFISLDIKTENDSIYHIAISFFDSAMSAEFRNIPYSLFYITKFSNTYVLINLDKPVPLIKGLGRKKEYRLHFFDDEHSSLELSLTKDSLKLNKIENRWGCLMTVPDEKLKPGLYRGDKPVANPRLQSIEDLYYRPVSIIHLNTTLTEILKEQNLSKASKKHKRP